MICIFDLASLCPYEESVCEEFMYCDECEVSKV